MKNYKNLFLEVKESLKPYKDDIITAFTILCVGLTSFGLGRLSILEKRKTPIIIENIFEATSTKKENGAIISDGANELASQDMAKGGLFVASKNGTKYYFPWCGGAQKIKEQNKIWFSSKEEAKKAGYSPAANCKGL